MRLVSLLVASVLGIATIWTEVLQRFASSVKIPLPQKPAVPKRLRIKGSSFCPDRASRSFSAKSEKLQHFPLEHPLHRRRVAATRTGRLRSALRGHRPAFPARL